MNQKDQSHWIRPEIRALSAYHVPASTGLSKLDAMENPYGWPPELKQQWLESLENIPLNRYPDPSAQALKQRLREAMNIGADMDLILGNGSDELIQILAMAVAAPGRAILSMEPGFVMYRMIATFCGLEYVPVPLGEQFELDKTASLAAIEQHKPALIFLAYPNNPTGNLFDEADMVELIRATDAIVVIDEAYTAFCGRSFMGRIQEFDNVLVMGTVSKLGLAGLRLGFLAGPSVYLQELEKIRLPYNINVLTQASACFALDNKNILDDQTATIVADRERLFAAMNQFDAIHCYPSSANFILFRLKQGKADAVFQSLLQDKVLIKNLSPSGGSLDQCLRVTVGTEQENGLFLQALEKALQP